MLAVNLLPLWQWQLVEYDISFVEVAKRAFEMHIPMQFLELWSMYCCPMFYTDALKSHAGVSYAAVTVLSGVQHSACVNKYLYG